MQCVDGSATARQPQQQSCDSRGSASTAARQQGSHNTGRHNRQSHLADGAAPEAHGRCIHSGVEPPRGDRRLLPVLQSVPQRVQQGVQVSGAPEVHEREEGAQRPHGDSSLFPVQQSVQARGVAEGAPIVALAHECLTVDWPLRGLKGTLQGVPQRVHALLQAALDRRHAWVVSLA